MRVRLRGVSYSGSRHLPDVGAISAARRLSAEMINKTSNPRTSDAGRAVRGVRPLRSVHAASRGGAPVHRRLVRLGRTVRLQQRGLDAVRECRKRVRGVPNGRRLDRRGQQPPDRHDLRGIQPLRPRLRGSTGATITQVRWSGRGHATTATGARTSERYPSGAPIFGLPVGQYCDATGFDNRGWPMPFAAPEGTTGSTSW